MSPITVWRLQAGRDRRFRGGHPWVYSNELAESPRGLEPGSAVELRDAAGKFLARGYGNPHSLIAFRALSRRPSDERPMDLEFVRARLEAAAVLRSQLGLSEASHRACFGEGDALPGLVIDRYRLDSGRWLDVVQPHTAGSERWVGGIAGTGEGGAVMVRRDMAVRKYEGIPVVEEPELRGITADELRSARIRVGSATFEVNLYDGQKTGFFLDQAQNIETALRLSSRLQPGAGRRQLKILDLCCYVGQWGVQLGAAKKAQGLDVEVTAVDASSQALELATANLKRVGVGVRALRRDVIHELADLPDGSFDCVVCDPPALVKSRKDEGPGAHAYATLNAQALRLVRAGGLLVTCSCSALLTEDRFLEALAKAERRAFSAGGREVRWVASGGQAYDHPSSVAFPEGRYLKARFGWVAN